LTKLQLSHLLLEVGDIFATIADVGVDALLDQNVVGGLSHITGGGDEGFLPLDLAVDRGNELVAVHDGRRRRGKRANRSEATGSGKINL
jgi:hypothetical protein